MNIIISLFFAALVMNSREDHAQKNNDALMLLQSFKGGYLAYTTDNDKDFECLVLRQLAIFIPIKSVVYAASFEEGDNPNRINVTQLAVVSESPDTFGVYFERDGATKEVNVTVLFSDYKSCFISSNPNSSPSCPMWVFFGSTEQEKKKCLKRFKTLCGPGVKKAYDEKRCGAPK